MNRSTGLGRGLGALIPSAAPGTSGLLTLRLSEIVPNPRQPRGTFDATALEELAHSLREFGLLQPIIVRRRDDDRYEIIAGERRFRAARLAGLHEVPAIVRMTADDQLLTEALVENIHRAQLNPLEEAAAYQQLLEDFDMTHEALATKLGKSRSTVSNTIRLLALPMPLHVHIASGALSAGHARALLALPSAEERMRAGQHVIDEQLSVRATEELVRRLTAAPSRDHAGEGEPAREGSADPAGASPHPSADRTHPFAGLQERLGDALATSVRIDGSERRGRIVIDYAGREDLERLLAVLSRGTGSDLLSEPS